MTPEEIMGEIAEDGVFYLAPDNWDDETMKSVKDLEEAGIIESCKKHFPNFINSSYDYIAVGAVPVVVDDGCGSSWIEIKRWQ